MELLGSLPAALLLVAIAWQLVLVGHALWSASNAARVAARAAAVGRQADTAARSALPSYLEQKLRVTRKGERVSVSLRVPLLLPEASSPLSVSASAAMERQ